jgi:hypothetical protein
MDGIALLGIFLLLYAGYMVYINVKKPEKIWNMYKIKKFRKLLGEKGTVIFLYIVAAVSAGAGIWLMVK